MNTTPHRLMRAPIALLTAALCMLAASTASAAPPDDEAITARHAELAAKRARHIQALKAYRDAGVFPDNSELAKPLAVFIDRNGVPCAFANVMIQDGQMRIVRRVSQTNNNVLVGDIKAGPVMDWILTSGLTHDEAAEIQVPGSMYREPRLPIDPIEPQRPEVVKRERIQQRLDVIISRLEAQTDWSLAVAVARSFDHASVQPWHVNRVVRQAAREAHARLKNPERQDQGWVRDVVAHNLR